MSIQIREVGADMLTHCATIIGTYTVESVFSVEVVDSGLGGLRFVEEKVKPYQKYDDIGPPDWLEYFDADTWGIFMAFDGSHPLGVVVVAIGTPGGMTTPFERTDMAVLWDIRVHPDVRRCGIGSMLFKYAADWARQRGCSQLKIETQSVNVPACRFYVRQGCKLGAVHRYGYSGCPDVAHEAMLLWYLDL